MTDTFPSKRYVFVCAACDSLSSGTRAHQVACSPACRVRLHRAPEDLRRLKADAARDGITPASILRGAASARL